MITSYEWATERASGLNKIFDPIVWRENAFAHAYDFLDSLSDGHEIALGFISDYQQSSKISHRQGESVVMFDTGQSLIIRNLLLKFANGASGHDISEIIKEAVSQFLQPIDDHFSLYLRNVSIHSKENQVLTPEQVEAHDQVLAPFRPWFHHESTLQITDYFILGHEYFHFLDRWCKFPLDREAVARHSFERALEVCCYEEDKDFKEKITYWGLFDFNEEQLSLLGNDLRNRRTHYLSKRERHIEEIACDKISFNLVLDHFTRNKDYSIDDFFQLATVFYIIFCFFDMHFGQTRRGANAIKASADQTLPADVADAHFRKMALVQSMWDTLSATLQFNGYEEQDLRPLADRFRKEFEQLKLAIDLLYTSEVSVRLRDSLKAARMAMDDQITCDKIPVIPQILYDFLAHDQLFKPEFLFQFFSQENDSNGYFTPVNR